MDIFSALADPTRRHIIELLSKHKKLSATTIANNFHMSQPAISQHLKRLRVAKLVDRERQAQKLVYQVNTDSLFELDRWIHTMTQGWTQRFDAMDTVLQTEKMKLNRKEVKYGKSK